MDPFSLKYNEPSSFSIPGYGTVKLKAVPLDNTFKIESESELLYMAKIASKSLEIPLDDLLESLTVQQLQCVFGEILKRQNESTPDVKELKRELTIKIHKDPMYKMDGMVIFNSQSLSDYYGKPSRSLTIGQIVYYFLMKQLYQDFIIGNKMVSKAWLEKSK